MTSALERMSPARLHTPMIIRSPWVAAGAMALAALLVSLGMSVAVRAQDAVASPSACPTPLASPSTDPSAPAISSTSATQSPMPDGTGGCDNDADGGSPTVTVQAGDLWFAPNEITIPSDEPTTLVLVGVGQVAHNLIVDELGLQLAVGPGTSSEVTVSDLAPGTYQFYCAIFGHRRAGMFGTLTVEEATSP